MRRDRTPLNRRRSFINRRKRSSSAEFGSDDGCVGGLGAEIWWRKRKGKVRKLRRDLVVVLGGFEEVGLRLVEG